MNTEKSLCEILEILIRVGRKPHDSLKNFKPLGEEIILCFIYLRGDNCTPGSLAEDAGVSSARVAAALRRAEKKGWVKREADAEDRRKVRISLTPSGRNFAWQQIVELVSCWKRIVEDLGEEDTANLIRIMEKLEGMLDGGFAPAEDEKLADELVRYFRQNPVPDSRQEEERCQNTV